MRNCPDRLYIDLGERTSTLNVEELFGISASRLELDIGCGKGRFLVARATANPGALFLGVDKKMKRILKVERKAMRACAFNIRLLCAEAEYVVSDLLRPGSVSNCYLFFPDPWPKRRHHRRRLFNNFFLDSLARVLTGGGKIHIATDHMEYFNAIADVLNGDARFKAIDPFVFDEAERTEFELVFSKQNATIYSCSFERI